MKNYTKSTLRSNARCNSNHVRQLALCCAVACALDGAMPVRAHAQSAHEGLDEVIVTARKREESIQEVPLAVSAFDAATIQKIGVTNIGDLAETVPALTMAPFPNSSSAMVVFMRGVGTVDSEQIARDAGVGIYLDDIYLGRAQGLTSDLADIERIEVLRGPQGTLYGRNTIGGAIKFITAKPSGEWGLKENVSVGSRDYLRTLTTLNLPRVADVSAALTYLDSRQDGTVDGVGDSPDFGQRNKRGYRAALRWQPLEQFTLDYAYDHSLQHGTNLYEQRGYGPGFGAQFGLASPISAQRRDTAIRAEAMPIHDDFTASGHALTAIWDVTEQITLKSISSYRKLDADSVHDTMEAFGIPAAFSTDTRQNQVSQEFLLNGEAKRLKYIAGAFYFRERADQETASIPNPYALAVNPFDPVNAFRPVTLSDLVANPAVKVENSSVAVYGQLTWTPAVLDDRLNISVGARESRDRREFSRTYLGAAYDDDSKTFSSFDPGIVFDYRWSDDLHTYASYSEGYRTGGFNARAPLNAPPFDPEQLTTYEIGVKSSWADRLRANVALYRSNYRDIQLDFIDPLTNLVSTVNAGKAEITGVELELTAAPVEGLQLGLDYAYMDAAQKDQVIDPLTQLPLLGTSLPFTPHNKYYGSAEYSLPRLSFGEVSARIGYSWDDRQTVNGGAGTDKDRRPSYGLLDARIALRDIPLDRYGKLAVALWGKNLEDKEYVIYRLYGAEIYGDPRTVGIDLTYQF